MAYEFTLQGKLTSTLDNCDDDLFGDTTSCHVVETDNEADLTEAEIDEIRDQLERRCYCEHDCCGHLFGGVHSITKVWPGRFVVLANYSRNY